jgi:hypothetical protein
MFSEKKRTKSCVLGKKKIVLAVVYCINLKNSRNASKGPPPAVAWGRIGGVSITALPSQNEAVDSCLFYSWKL